MRGGLILGLTIVAASLLLGQAAFADQPHAWGIGLQDAASPVMEDIIWFHNSLMMPVITIITLFVMGLMVYVMVRFNKKANPNPSNFTHNTTVEVLWTVVPVIILVVIAVPSFKLLYKADRTSEPEMTLKVTGNQWYWTYEYPDNGKFSFDSNMVADDKLKPGQPRLLEVDNRIVIPVDTVVRLQVTANDVLHSWTIPAFGRKLDAVPGRLNETYIGPVKKEGVYYGQCSELCGANHGFMPIAVEVVSKAKFDAWVAAAKKKFASDDAPSVRTYALNETK